MIVKLLTEHDLEFLSLKGGCTGSSVSIHVKMPHCWKSLATAQIFSYVPVNSFVLGAQKNRLVETVLFSTHNICFG